LQNFLNPTDVLVLNDTKVIRARTKARLERSSGTSREMEVFFAEPVAGEAGNLWNVLCKPGRRIRPGDRAVFGSGKLSGVFRESLGANLHILELETSEPIEQILNRIGQIPLPPYMDRDETPADERDYQTVFATHSGAVAPTAGLHFTDSMLAAIRARGVVIVTVTLHVGIGTFLPVRTEIAENHILHPERFEISGSTAEILRNAHREQQRRVVSVGTTTTRTLEYLMQQYGEIRAGAGKTDLYILPGFQFKIVDALLTNFHLPRSTLFMLVSAFGGREAIRNAYRRAIEAHYRFYSYGDCMFIQK
jgi:S-adenosylmethionine:tRNA ribosyltransferase-isomerase